MKRILVAEDNDSNYMLMNYILKHHMQIMSRKKLLRKKRKNLLIVKIGRNVFAYTYIIKSQ